MNVNKHSRRVVVARAIRGQWMRETLSCGHIIRRRTITPRVGCDGAIAHASLARHRACVRCYDEYIREIRAKIASGAPGYRFAARGLGL